MKYFITGVSGFVGRYFVEYLQKKENDADIFGADIAPSCNLPIKYRQIDLIDKAATSEIIGNYKPDYIVHLASISSVGQSWQNPSFCFVNNTTIMLNILEAVVQNKLNSRILSIGSSEEYGDGEMPFAENMPLNPKNPYAVAKVSQELLGKLYAENMGCDVVMTRSFNHIGPNQSERFVVPSFMRQIVNIKQGAENKMSVGNINVARDFLDVRDVVDAYYKILHKAKSGAIYNVCSGKTFKLSEIIKIAEDISGININVEVDTSRLRPNDVMVIVGSNQKIKQELGWEPRYDMQQTIKDILLSMEQDNEK